MIQDLAQATYQEVVELVRIPVYQKPKSNSASRSPASLNKDVQVQRRSELGPAEKKGVSGTERSNQDSP